MEDHSEAEPIGERDADSSESAGRLVDLDLAAVEMRVNAARILMVGEHLLWRSQALMEALRITHPDAEIIHLNSDDLLLRYNQQHDIDTVWLEESIPIPEATVAGNHRAVAGTKKGRQLINIRPKWTTNFDPNHQGERQAKRAAKYYMVPGTAGTMIIQTRSSAERNLVI